MALRLRLRFSKLCLPSVVFLCSYLAFGKLEYEPFLIRAGTLKVSVHHSHNLSS
jgi:hypothetical protein